MFQRLGSKPKQFRYILGFSFVAFVLLGALQPSFIDFAFLRSVSSALSVDVFTILASTAFSLSFFVLLLAIYVVFDKTPQVMASWGYLAGIVNRSVPKSTSILRVCLSISYGLVCVKYIDVIYDEGVLRSGIFPDVVAEHPKVIDRILPFVDLGYGTWMAIALAVCVLAAVGLSSRITLTAAWVLTLYFVSHVEALSANWSHGEVPIILAGIPVLLRNMSGTWHIGRLWGAPSVPAPYGPVFFVQVFLAFFYFGAFAKKMILGGMYWVTSDHFTNSVDIGWSTAYAEIAKPVYVQVVQGSEILLVLSSWGHLAMQAIPILILFSAHKPWARAFEGMVFVAGVVLLWAFMGYLWPWYWWLFIGAAFLDWDYFLGNKTEDVVGDEPVKFWRTSQTWYGVLPAYLLSFMLMVLSIFGPKLLDAYPFFDDLGFYALPYDSYPYGTDDQGYFTTNGMMEVDAACGSDLECHWQNRVFGTTNSPAYKVLSALPPEQQAALLQDCREAQQQSFCRAASAGALLGSWSVVLAYSEGQGTVMTAVGYVTAQVADSDVAPPLWLSVAVNSEGKLVFEGSAAPRVVDTETLRLDRDSGALLPTDDLLDRSSCFLITNVTFQDGTTLPFVSQNKCRWRLDADLQPKLR